jgi:hypothetical protein
LFISQHQAGTEPKSQSIKPTLVKDDRMSAVMMNNRAIHCMAINETTLF